MKFNLKDKLQQAKDAGTAALSIAVMTVDAAADRAIEKFGDLQDATARKTGEIREIVGEKVGAAKEVLHEKTDATMAVMREKTDVVKEKTVTGLGKLGDAIGDGAGKVSTVAAQFGKSARNRLNLRKEEPVVAPVVQAAVKKAQKRTKTKKPAGKKPSR